MGYCNEFILKDLVTITAIPVGDVAVGPMALLSPKITTSQLTVAYSHAVVIGRVPATAGGDLIPIISDSGKAKDDVSDAVAGRRHKVAVSCDVDDREPHTWDLLRRLEQEPFCLMLTYRGGEYGFAYADEDTYACTVERDDKDTAVKFSIENLSGIQRIVDLY